MLTTSPTEQATILVVEDAFVGGFLRDALVRRGYRVICAECAGALKILRQEGVPVDLLITNSPAPFTGFPQLPLLYIAACPDPAATRRFQSTVSLRKPFRPGELFATVKQLVR